MIYRGTAIVTLSFYLIVFSTVQYTSSSKVKHHRLDLVVIIYLFFYLLLLLFFFWGGGGGGGGGRGERGSWGLQILKNHIRLTGDEMCAYVE